MREWTLHEADEALPRVRGMLAAARAALAEARRAQQHVEDLRIVHGSAVVRPEHPAHAEWTRFARQAAERQEAVTATLEEFARAGIALKDLEQGLVDFPTRHGDQLVFLCWKEGEERVAAWHPIAGGFASRRPVPMEIRPDV